MRFGLFVMQWVLMLLGVAWLAASLSGCASAPDPVCPVLVPYSRADDAALLAEIGARPTPVTHRYLRDYASLRAQVRVCAAGEK